VQYILKSFEIDVLADRKPGSLSVASASAWRWRAP